MSHAIIQGNPGREKEEDSTHGKEKTVFGKGDIIGKISNESVVYVLVYVISGSIFVSAIGYFVYLYRSRIWKQGYTRIPSYWRNNLHQYMKIYSQRIK